MRCFIGSLLLFFTSFTYAFNCEIRMLGNDLELVFNKGGGIRIAAFEPWDFVDGVYRNQSGSMGIQNLIGGKFAKIKLPSNGFLQVSPNCEIWGELNTIPEFFSDEQPLDFINALGKSSGVVMAFATGKTLDAMMEASGEGVYLELEPDHPYLAFMIKNNLSFNLFGMTAFVGKTHGQGSGGSPNTTVLLDFRDGTFYAQGEFHSMSLPGLPPGSGGVEFQRIGISPAGSMDFYSDVPLPVDASPNPEFAPYLMENTHLMLGGWYRRTDAPWRYYGMVILDMDSNDDGVWLNGHVGNSDHVSEHHDEHVAVDALRDLGLMITGRFQYNFKTLFSSGRPLQLKYVIGKGTMAFDSDANRLVWSANMDKLEPEEGYVDFVPSQHKEISQTMKILSSWATGARYASKIYGTIDPFNGDDWSFGFQMKNIEILNTKFSEEFHVNVTSKGLYVKGGIRVPGVQEMEVEGLIDDSHCWLKVTNHVVHLGNDVHYLSLCNYNGDNFLRPILVGYSNFGEDLLTVFAETVDLETQETKWFAKNVSSTAGMLKFNADKIFLSHDKWAIDKGTVRIGKSSVDATGWVIDKTGKTLHKITNSSLWDAFWGNRPKEAKPEKNYLFVNYPLKSIVEQSENHEWKNSKVTFYQKEREVLWLYSIYEQNGEVYIETQPEYTYSYCAKDAKQDSCDKEKMKLSKRKSLLVDASFCRIPPSWYGYIKHRDKKTHYDWVYFNEHCVQESNLEDNWVERIHSPAEIRGFLGWSKSRYQRHDFSKP